MPSKILVRGNSWWGAKGLGESATAARQTTASNKGRRSGPSLHHQVCPIRKRRSLRGGGGGNRFRTNLLCSVVYIMYATWFGEINKANKVPFACGSLAAKEYKVCLAINFHIKLIRGPNRQEKPTA